MKFTAPNNSHLHTILSPYITLWNIIYLHTLVSLLHIFYTISNKLYLPLEHKVTTLSSSLQPIAMSYNDTIIKERLVNIMVSHLNLIILVYIFNRMMS